MQERKIKSISFLYGDERISIEPTPNGKFRIPLQNISTGKQYKYFSAREIVEHEILKSLDPFLTLTTGEKVRVYQGGDPTYKPVFVESILDQNEPKKIKIEEHDMTQGSFDYYEPGD